MKRAKPGALILAFLALALCAGCVKDGSTTVTLNPDGSFTLTESLVLDRKVAEKRLRSLARRREKAEKKKSVKGPMSPEDIRELIMEILEREADKGEGPAGRVVITETEISVSRGYTGISIEDFYSKHNPFRYLGFSHVKVEEAPAGTLRMELGRDEGKGDPNMGAEMILAFRGVPRYTIGLSLPGEITSSDLPETDGRVTRLLIQNASNNGKRKADLVALRAVEAKDSLVFECKKGIFSGPLPIDSRPIMEEAMEEKSYGHGMPVTKAGPGWVAEPGFLQFKKVIRLGEKSGQAPHPLEDDTGSEVSVTGALFPPEGRFILDLEKLTFSRALDDQGRPVGIHSGGGRHRSDFSEPVPGIEFEVKLALPDRRARAIESMDGCFVGVSACDFKEMKIARPTLGKRDASDALAGTELIVLGIDQDDDNFDFSLRVKGPEKIRYLIFSGFCQGENGGYSHVGEDETRAVKGGFVRTLRLAVGCYGSSESEGIPGLLVRMPVDLKRERLDFRLDGMDLY